MPTRNAMPASRWIAQVLHGCGLTHLFFVDAVLRRTLIQLRSLGVQPVLAHSEKAAAYMADGYARIRGVGLCCAQSVGAANLAAGLQDAWLARSPVIALTGRKPPSHQGRNAYQEIPHNPMYAAVTKFDAVAEGAEQLPRLLRQAWRMARSGTPRPVHIDLNGVSADIVEREDIHEPAEPDPSMMLPMPPHRPLPGMEEVERAAKALAGRKVVIVAGAGAAQSGAGEELLRVAERLGAPVGTSLGGHGMLPTSHPLSIGTVGTYGAPPANRIVSEAEAVLFVGCHTGDQVTVDWTVPATGTPIVQIDIDPSELGRNYPGTIGVCGDPRAALALLAEQLPPPPQDAAFARRAAETVAEWRRSMAPLLASDEQPIRVERLCAELGKALPPDAILVADTGYSGIWSCTLVDLEQRGQTYLRAAGSLGWAFPAALGAKCAAPGRPVVCFCGDGAFYYHLSELATARRRKIAVVVVVNNNSGLGQGWPNLKALQTDPSWDASELLLYEPTDFAEVARGFGVRGIRVDRPDEIGPALRAALAANETVVVDVATNLEGRAPEPWLPGAGR